MPPFVDFKKPNAELEGKIEGLRHLQDGGALNIPDEVTRMPEKAERMLRTTCARLASWQKVQVARHPERPHLGYAAKPARSGQHDGRLVANRVTAAPLEKRGSAPLRAL